MKRRGDVAPLILSLCVRWKWVVSFTPRLFCARNLLNRKLDGPQNCPGESGEKKIFLAPFRESS